jgi:hypothetical protein
MALSGCILGFRFGPLPDGFGPGWVPSPSGAITGEPSAAVPVDLPDLPLVDLPDAPSIAIWEPQPDHRIRISAWRSRSITELFVVPLLHRDATYRDHVRVVAGPSGRFVAVVEAADGPTITRSFVRVFSNTGDLVWTAPDDVAANPAIRWSPDGERLAIDARGRWIVLTLRGRLLSTIEIDTRRTSASGQADDPWELLDFSEDGRAIFGSRSLGQLRGAYPLGTVPSSGGPIRPLDDLPTGAGERLAPLRRLMDAPLEAPLDPRTGRIALPMSNGTLTSVTIEVRSGPDRQTATVPWSAAEGPVDLAWLDGSLLVLHDGPRTGVQQLGVVSMGADLGTERKVASFPIVGQHARLIALTEGFAILAFGRGFGEAPSRLLLVRVADGVATVADPDADPATSEMFGFAGWWPPSGSTIAVRP